jgi:hypothetical protein
LVYCCDEKNGCAVLLDGTINQKTFISTQILSRLFGRETAQSVANAIGIKTFFSMMSEHATLNHQIKKPCISAGLFIE